LIIRFIFKNPTRLGRGASGQAFPRRAWERENEKHRAFSFPCSAWECLPRRSASW